MHETSSHANDVCRSFAFLNNCYLNIVEALHTTLSHLFSSIAWSLTAMSRNMKSPSQHKIWDLSVCFECHMRQLRHSGGNLRPRRPALASSAVKNTEPGNGSMRRSLTPRAGLGCTTGTRNVWTSPRRTSSRYITTSTSVSTSHSRLWRQLIEYPLVVSYSWPVLGLRVHLPKSTFLQDSQRSFHVSRRRSYTRTT